MAFMPSLPPQIMQLLAQQQQPQPAPQPLPPFQLPQLMQTAPLPSDPAAQAFLNRFGPYRLQAFDAMRPGPAVTGGNIGLFQPRGMPEEEKKPKSLFPVRKDDSGSPGGGRR